MKSETIGTSQDFGYLGLHNQQVALGPRDQINGGATNVALRGGGLCAQNGMDQVSSYYDYPGVHRMQPFSHFKAPK